MAVVTQAMSPRRGSGVNSRRQYGRVLLPSRIGLVSLLLVIPLGVLLIQLLLNREDQLLLVERKLQAIEDVQALYGVLDSAERLRDLGVITVYARAAELQDEYEQQRKSLLRAIEDLRQDSLLNRHNPLIELTIPRLLNRLDRIRPVVGTEVNTPQLAYQEHQPLVESIQQLQFRLADQGGLFNDQNKRSLVLVYIALDESIEQFNLLGKARAYGSLYLRMGHVPSDGAVTLEQLYERMLHQHDTLAERVSQLLKKHESLRQVPPFNHRAWLRLDELADYLDDQVIQSADLALPWREYFDHVSGQIVQFANARNQILQQLVSVYQQERIELRNQQRTYLISIVLLVLVFVVLYLMDLREIRNREAVRKEKEAAEAADKAKSQFLATMSHELRTPINGVLGMVELMSSTPLNEEQRDYLAALRSSGQTLLSVINDVLDFSKIEAGKLQIENVVFDVRQTLNETLAIFAPQMKQKQLDFSCSVDDSVPPLVCSDPSRLRQILLNLVGNALKFTEQGSVTVQLSLKRINNRDFIHGVVRDSGIGMDAQQQAELFKQFSQADKSIARRYGGTGLGLAICQRLCQLLGGDIGVSSAPGVGTSFWFTVALQDMAQATVSGAETISQEQRLQYYAEQFRARRVLVAEDNKVNQMVVQGMLKKVDLQVEVVENGVQAVERVCQAGQHYDWILMDWEMPEMDGLTACKQIRAWEIKTSRPVTPIVALTAHVLSDYEQQAYAAGMQGFLKKPIDQNALYQSLYLTLNKTTE